MTSVVDEALEAAILQQIKLADGAIEFLGGEHYERNLARRLNLQFNDKAISAAVVSLVERGQLLKVCRTPSQYSIVSRGGHYIEPAVYALQLP